MKQNKPINKCMYFTRKSCFSLTVTDGYQPMAINFHTEGFKSRWKQILHSPGALTFHSKTKAIN